MWVQSASMRHTSAGQVGIHSRGVHCAGMRAVDTPNMVVQKILLFFSGKKLLFNALRKKTTLPTHPERNTCRFILVLFPSNVLLMISLFTPFVCIRFWENYASIRGYGHFQDSQFDQSTGIILGPNFICVALWHQWKVLCKFWTCMLFTLPSWTVMSGLKGTVNQTF